MGKMLTILLLFFLTLLAEGKTPGNNYTLSYPQYIPQNSQYDISLVTSSPYLQADRLELYINCSKSTLNKVEFKSLTNSLKLEFKSEQLEGLTGKTYKTIIYLNRSNLEANSFFEITSTLKAGSGTSEEVNFYGVYKQGGNSLCYLNSHVIEDNTGPEENFITAGIKFYAPQKYAGRCVNMGGNSFISLSLNKEIKNEMLLSCWIKANSSSLTFLKIKNKKIPNNDYVLSVNSFGMLTLEEGSGYGSYNPEFISNYSWYNLIIFGGHKELQFYINNKKFASVPLRSFVAPDDFIFTFPGAGNRSYQLDMLGLYETSGSPGSFFTKINYPSVNRDSSFRLVQYSFDEENELAARNDYLNFTYTGLSYRKSDAPLFAPSPELNIIPLNSSVKLEWNGGDYKQAAQYMLEKSDGKADFRVIASVEPYDYEGTYSLSDSKDENSVAFYRIKQVNKDGSTVYSSAVKVGLGEITPFIVKQNYPNPFNPKTSIEVELLEDSELEIIIYNLGGSEIEKLKPGRLSKGIYKFPFDASQLPSGIYLYKVTAGGKSVTKKMILTK